MLNKPIKVLHIIGGKMDYGGIENLLMNYFRHIDKKLIQFDFMITDLNKGVFDDEIRSLGGKIFNVPSKKQNLIKNLTGTYSVLKSNRTSIIHSHLDGMNGLVLIISFLAGNKFRISHSHSTNHLTRKKSKIFIHNIFRFISRVFATDFMSSSIEASFWLHGEKITNFKNKIIINAIDYNKFAHRPEIRNALRKEMNLDSCFVLGHVGGFRFEKNQLFLLELLKLLIIKDKSIVLILVGDGEGRLEIESRINQLKIQNNVYLIGKTINTAAYFNLFDLFVLPSFFEGLGIVAIEAQVNGLNVIASNGVPRISKISERMIFIETDDTNKWLDTIMKISLQFNDSSRKVEKSRVNAAISTMFDISKATHVLVKEYNEIVSRTLLSDNL